MEYGVGNGVAESARVPAVVPFHEDAGAWPAKRHSPGNAWHSTIGKHIPAFLHQEFTDSLANAGDVSPDASLRKWYATTEDAYRGTKAGDDPVKFWRKRFEEWQGSTTKARGSGGLQPLEDFIPTRFRNGGAA